MLAERTNGLPEGPYKLFHLDLNGNLYSSDSDVEWGEGMSLTNEKGIEIHPTITPLLLTANRITNRVLDGVQQRVVSVVGTVRMTPNASMRLTDKSMIATGVTLQKVYCCPIVNNYPEFSKSFLKFKNSQNV